MYSYPKPRLLLAYLAHLSLALASSVLCGEEEIRKVSLHTLSTDPAGIEDLFIQTEGEWISLHTPATYISHAVRYEGTGPLVIYRRQATVEPEGFDYVPVATREIPGGQEELLLLLSRRAGDFQLDVKFVNLEAELFPNGSFLFINHTDETVVVKIDDEQLELEAKTSRYFQPADRGAGTKKVRFVTQGDTEQKSYVANTWFYRPSIRQLALIVPEADTSRFVVRVINLRNVDPGE